MTGIDDFDQEFAKIIASLDQPGDRLADLRASLPAPGRLHRVLRRPPLDEQQLFTLRIDLEHSKPPIWRRLQVHSDISLLTLHHAIQGAFAWEDRHLFRFWLGDAYGPKSESFLCPWDADEGETTGTPVGQVRLDETVQQPSDLLNYTYDYGDDWGLKILLEKVEDSPANSAPILCVGGKRAAPPEDCGSLRTEEDLAQVLEDPSRFDLEEANAAIAMHLVPHPTERMGEMLQDTELRDKIISYTGFRDLIDLTMNPYSRVQLFERLLSVPDTEAPRDPGIDPEAELLPILWLLHEVGDGIKLTQAGFLPPAVARAFGLMLLPTSDHLMVRGGSESKMRLPHAYRTYLLKLGLFRKSRGMLLPTRAGVAARGDAAALWEHIVNRLADSITARENQPRNFDRDATALVLLHAAQHEDFSLKKIATELSEAGWGYDDHSPIHETELLWYSANPAMLFFFLGPRESRALWQHSLRPAAVTLAQAALIRSRRNQ